MISSVKVDRTHSSKSLGVQPILAHYCADDVPRFVLRKATRHYPTYIIYTPGIHSDEVNDAWL